MFKPGIHSASKVSKLLQATNKRARERPRITPVTQTNTASKKMGHNKTKSYTSASTSASLKPLLEPNMDLVLRSFIKNVAIPDIIIIPKMNASNNG